jgi:hypothetical protein
MDSEISLDELTTNSVSVKTVNYTTIDGVKYYLGDPHRCAYVNSTSGRAAITAALAEPYLSAVMAVWGNTPTIVIAE